MYKLFINKLAESGLNVSDAIQLGFSFLPAEATEKLGFSQLPALKIDYFSPQNGEILYDFFNAEEPYFRIRYLAVPASFVKTKVAKYMQKPLTLPAAFYPKNIEWSTILEDVNKPVVITEGEFKAAKACKEGFPTIGLGGVYNWRALKRGIEWLPSLDFMKWPRREVYICFDSDYKTNSQVCRALYELAVALENKGAFVNLVTLPALDTVSKTGLDDFMVAEGVNGPEKFRKLLSEAEPLGLSKILWKLNSEYVYVRNPGLIINKLSHNKISYTTFISHLEATATYQERKLSPNGDVSYKAVPAAEKWIRWPLRNEVEKITYSPGHEQIMDTSKGVFYNTWRGWGCQPEKGEVKLFLDLINHIFTGMEDEGKQWFLRWCAFPLQNPGFKMFSSAVIHGIKHGTGKSLIGYTLGRIYGENFTEISQVDLHSVFNEWAEGKQFVMGDDVTGSDKRADADFLKKLITQKEIRVNMKYMPTYTVPDRINYFFTANHPDAFFLEDDDRRFFIHEVTVKPLPEEFYLEYTSWLDSGGDSAIFDYLLNLDLGDFNPAGPAYKTAARTRMIETVRSDLAMWVRELLNTPDAVLKLGQASINRDLFTNKELLLIYDPLRQTKTTANGLGRELSKAGIRQVANGAPFVLSDGTQQRLYAVKNVDKWLNASAAEIAAYIKTKKI